VIACSLLATGESKIWGYDGCEDSERALAAAEALGVRVSKRQGLLTLTPSQTVEDGVGEVVLDFGGSATSMRIFTSISCVTPGIKLITGSPQLLRRPIKPLLDALAQLGAKIEASDGFQPPLKVHPTGLRGGSVELDASLSSQYTSSIMVGSTRADSTTNIRHIGGVVSKGYISLTAKVLELFGRPPAVSGDFSEIVVEPGELRPVELSLEGDYSSASFLLAAGAIAGQVEVGNLNPESLQPDREIVEVLKRTGCYVKVGSDCVRVERSKLEAFEVDVTDTPDLTPILAVLAAYSKGHSAITGVERLRFKESDRIASTIEMLKAIGVNSRYDGRAIHVWGGEVRGGLVDSKGDHRIAMAAAVAALGAQRPVVVKEFECHRKSYPSFLEHYSAIGGRTAVVAE